MIKFSRKSSIFLNGLINNWIPPVLRDSKLLMKPLMRILLGKKTDLFLNFRARAYSLSLAEYNAYYEETAECNLLKETDLNAECLARIPKEMQGETVLDVGCGRGVLTRILAESHKVTAVDVVSGHASLGEHVRFVQANVESLPFGDGSFDTVICTHVLEHVLDIHKALGELVRVARNKLVLVLPRERVYQFGFNLHLHFFPYQFVVEQLLAPHFSKASIELEGGDWFICAQPNPR